MLLNKINFLIDKIKCENKDLFGTNTCYIYNHSTSILEIHFYIEDNIKKIFITKLV